MVVGDRRVDVLGAIQLPAQQPNDALLPGDVGIPPSRLAGQRIPASDGEHEIVRQRVRDCFPITTLERFIRLAKERLIWVHDRHLRYLNSQMPRETSVSG